MCDCSDDREHTPAAIAADGLPGRGGNATIEGGQSRRVAKGDVILILAGTPHWYKDLDGSITYLEGRFDLRK